MAADRVVLVFRFQHHPGKVFLSGTREVGDGRRGVLPRTEPTFDDEIQRAQHFSPEQGVAFREYWRVQGRRDCWLEDRHGNGPLFERNQSPAVMQTERLAEHEARFVPLQGGGYDGLDVGFQVKHNPQRGWYIRSIDVPSLAAEHKDLETLWSSESPEAVVTKLIEAWGLAVAVPYEDPRAVQRSEQERQHAAQLPSGVRARPGSR